jgi:hypothetical protein
LPRLNPDFRALIGARGRGWPDAPTLLIDCGDWLHRDDFTSQFATTVADASDGRPSSTANGR